MTDLRPTICNLLQGLWLPLVTPFRDGELDEASLRRLVRHYAARPGRRTDPRGHVGRRHDARHRPNSSGWLRGDARRDSRQPDATFRSASGLSGASTREAAGYAG